MADDSLAVTAVTEPVAPVAAPAPAADVAPASAPVESAPAVVPDATPVVEAPKVDAAAPTEPVKDAPPTVPATEVKPEEKPASLLGDAADKDAKPAAPVDPNAPAVLPTYEAFVLPEGVSVSENGLKGVTDLLGQFELDVKANPADAHRLVQDVGQKFVDMYIAQKSADAQAQADNWVNTRKAWQDEVKTDPVYGRNRHETFMRDAARVRDMFGSDRFRSMIDMTGAGDHPGMMDFVHNVAKFLDRHGLLREGKPVPAPTQKAIPQKTGPRARYTASTVQ